MNSNYVLVLALGIGVVAGLRALTPPALVSWAARMGSLNLHGTPLQFMGTTLAVVLFSLGAIGEYVNDTLPRTPSRTSPPQLITRILTGAFSAACLWASSGRFLLTGALLGAIGAVAGTFGGYQVRMRLVRGLKVKDIFVAVPEDLVAIGLAYLFVTLR